MSQTVTTKLSKFEELRAQYDAAVRIAAIAAERVKELRAEMLRACEHPPEYQSEYKWEWDDGYGTQKWRTGRVCKCGAKNSWWPHSNHWSRE